MAKKSVGLFDQHVEKVALGLCASLLIAAVVFTFGGFRFSVNDQDPAKLCEQARVQADQLASAVRNASLPRPNPGNDDPSQGPVAALKSWFGPSAKGLIQIAGIQPRPIRTQRFPPSACSISTVDPDERHGLARIVPPSVPIVSSGQTTFDMVPKLEFNELIRAGREIKGAEESTRRWVSVAAQVDLVEQDVNFIAENYPSGSYLTVVGVHLQRKDETEPWRDWEDVDAFVAFKPIERPKIGESLEPFRRLLDNGCDYIARPKLPERRKGDRLVLPPVPYLQDPPEAPDTGASPSEVQRRANRRARKWRDLAKKALEGKLSSKVVDLDAALMLARASLASGAADKETQKTEQLLNEIIRSLSKAQRSKVSGQPPRVPERLMPLVAHDLSASPGHVYKYRLRYEVLNPYAGVVGELTDPADAERLTVFSDWSPPGRPVEIESNVHFFLTSANPKREEVTVTVFKRTRTGRWEKKDYRVKVGSDIGKMDKLVKRLDFSTKTLCIDIEFNRKVGQGRPTTALVYLDRDSGLLRERLLSEDKKLLLLKRLNRLRTGG